VRICPAHHPQPLQVLAASAMTPEEKDHSPERSPDLSSTASFARPGWAPAPEAIWCVDTAELLRPFAQQSPRAPYAETSLEQNWPEQLSQLSPEASTSTFARPTWAPGAESMMRVETGELIRPVPHSLIEAPPRSRRLSKTSAVPMDAPAT
jgi:hypothetical protein